MSTFSKYFEGWVITQENLGFSVPLILTFLEGSSRQSTMCLVEIDRDIIVWTASKS